MCIEVQGGCTKVVLREAVAPVVSAIVSGVVRRRICPPLSLQYVSGSGSSKNVGSPLGYFSPVNVNAPEFGMNSVRAAMPLGVPRRSTQGT